MATYSPESLGINASTTGGTFQQGAWYGGRQYWNNTLGEVGAIHPESNQQGAGQAVSTEVVAQTNPSNVEYLSQLQQSPQLSLPTTTNVAASLGGLESKVNTARKTLEETIGTRKETVDAELAALKEKEAETLSSIEELSQPFREQLEQTQREQLYINENFEANQKLVGELEQLLTEGNNLIQQQSEVTGLEAVRNPRIQRTMDDVSARVGVIEAVMNARNGQIAVAENLIDRSISNITADRQDQISYYETVLSLNRQDIIDLDDESEKLADEQLSLLKTDLENAQATSDYVKQLLLNPETASLMGQAGVSLTDSVETINAKLTQAQYVNEVSDFNNQMALDGATAIFDPSSVSADQLITLTDSRGVKHYYKKASTGTNSVADTFLKKYLLGGTDDQSLDDITATITDDQYNSILSIADSVVAPSFTPSNGIGSRYTDSLGRTWVYDVSGWRQL